MFAKVGKGVGKDRLSGNKRALSVAVCFVIANEAADPRGSAVELANHRAVREYRRKI